MTRFSTHHVLLLLAGFWWGLANYGLANETQTDTSLDDSFCATGTRDQLEEFFLNEGFVIFAEGVRDTKQESANEFVNTLFLVDRSSDHFHVVKLKPQSDNEVKACIFVSAREIDFKAKSPIAGLIATIPREHLLFVDQIPNDGVCPQTRSRCAEWSQWSHNLRNTQLLSGYIYSSKWDYDAYDAIVQMSLEGREIPVTRGALALFARQKYAARMRGEVQESDQDRQSALQLYKRIHDEVDHGHPVLLMWVADQGEWSISAIDRLKGLVWTPIHGTRLQLYPQSRDYYQRFMQQEQNEP